MKTLKPLFLCIIAAMTLFSCSKGITNNTLIGDWVPSHEEYYIDGKEIVLEEGQCLLLYNEESEEYSDFIDYVENDPTTITPGLSISFYENGQLFAAIFPGNYTIKGNKVYCSVPLFDTEEEFTLTEDYLYSEDETPITGYIIATSLYPEPEDIIINNFKYKACTFKEISYLKKKGN